MLCPKIMINDTPHSPDFDCEFWEMMTLEKQLSVHQKSIKTPHGNHEHLSKTFLFIHQVEVSMGNIETMTCCVQHMTQDQINTSACVFLLTTCVRWAACCVWAQRWSGRRGKGCWIPPGAAERSRWWTAADELAPPGWSWTPQPRTTSSPVATQHKHAQTSWLTRQKKKKPLLWLTFSLKCHDPPTITAWALKSCTFISPVPHINSWRVKKGKKKHRIPKCLFNPQQTFIINITHTSNSFSSNMASRFSGTSSFKPAIIQGVWFKARTFEFLGDATHEIGIPYLSGSVLLHPSPGWPVGTVPTGLDNASCFHW